MRTLFLLAILTFVIVSCKTDDAVVPLDEGLTIEVTCICEELDHALLTLQSADTIINAELVHSPEENKLYSKELDVPIGSYELTISIFEGKDLIEGIEGARGSLFIGIESISHIEVSSLSRQLHVAGPKAEGTDFDLLPLWSDRYFQVFEDNIKGHLTMSFPADPCIYDLRFIPTYLPRQPRRMYIDYFLYSESETVAIAFDECENNCDIIHLVRNFGDRLTSEEDEKKCVNMDWILADTVIMLTYGDETGDLVIFYQRWNENREVVMPAKNDKGRRVNQLLNNRKN